MLSLTRIAASRTTSLVLPKAAAASGISRRLFAGIGSDLAAKVRVCLLYFHISFGALVLLA